MALFEKTPSHKEILMYFKLFGLDEKFQKSLMDAFEKGFQKGFQEGFQKGFQEGFQEGLKKGEIIGADKSTRNHIIRQLTRRFGFVPEQVALQLDQVTGQELVLLFDGVTDSADLLAFVQFFETIVTQER